MKSQEDYYKDSILKFFELYADKRKNPVAHKHMGRKIDELLWAAKEGK